MGCLDFYPADQGIPPFPGAVLKEAHFTMVAIRDINDRSREIFRGIVETYLETGEPVGSRYLSRHLGVDLSAASIRNVMSDLESLGLLFSPHTSAGRIPTDAGLRMFVDGLLQVGVLSEDEQSQIETQITQSNKGAGSVEEALREASMLLSGLSRCAGLVLAPKTESRLKHVEFVPMDARRALVVMVTEDGSVENRVIDLPQGLPPSALQEATNFLNAKLRGLSVADARRRLQAEIEQTRREISELTSRIVEEGFATWSGAGAGAPASGPDALLSRSLIVTGQSRLLDDVTAMEDLERVRLLFEELENKTDVVQLLGLAEEAEGVKLFIGSETKLFGLSGSSVVVKPFRDQDRQIVGVIGVIGPTRLNYARIIPMVDYTAGVVSRLLSRGPLS